jgi:hypothetical protein
LNELALAAVAFAENHQQHGQQYQWGNGAEEEEEEEESSHGWGGFGEMTSFSKNSSSPPFHDAIHTLEVMP